MSAPRCAVRWLVALLGGPALLLVAPAARACGVSASGVASCSLAEHAEEVRPHWATGVSALYTSTELRFDGSVDADQTRYAALAALAYLPTATLVLQAGVGVALGGSLTLPDGKHEFLPGPTGSLGVDWRAWDDGRFFLLLSAVLSASFARTQLPGAEAVGYQALDLRIGGQFGVDVADVLRPYAVARAFGGPIFWQYQGADVSGTDAHHYQLGAGLGVRLSRLLNAFVEGIPLGEQALSLGVGLAF
ncbi:MAG TPA: hypothetical protein VJU61_09950 [Polyangiaceae bacterium]|nr:hypothetical protein [Polyangiaceae bacterium]